MLAPRDRPCFKCSQLHMTEARCCTNDTCCPRWSGRHQISVPTSVPELLKGVHGVRQPTRFSRAKSRPSVFSVVLDLAPSLVPLAACPLRTLLRFVVFLLLLPLPLVLLSSLLLYHVPGNLSALLCPPVSCPAQVLYESACPRLSRPSSIGLWIPSSGSVTLWTPCIKCSAG